MYLYLGLKGFDIKPIDPLRVEKPITGMSQWLKLESRNVVLYGSANLKVLDFQYVTFLMFCNVMIKSIFIIIMKSSSAHIHIRICILIKSKERKNIYIMKKYVREM